MIAANNSRQILIIKLSKIANSTPTQRQTPHFPFQASHEESHHHQITQLKIKKFHISHRCHLLAKLREIDRDLWHAIHLASGWSSSTLRLDSNFAPGTSSGSTCSVFPMASRTTAWEDFLFYHIYTRAAHAAIRFGNVSPGIDTFCFAASIWFSSDICQCCLDTWW